MRWSARLRSPPGPRDLCRNGEQTLFGCQWGAKIAALCASPDATNLIGYVQYRYGTPGHLELVYPSQHLPAKGHFLRRYESCSGGGDAFVLFRNGGYDYALGSKLIRTNFTPGESNDPQDVSSVTVSRNGKLESERDCRAVTSTLDDTNGLVKSFAAAADDD